MTTTVDLKIDKDVARVTFASADGFQKMSSATRQQLSSVLDELESMSDCRVVLFEAEGRTFIAGANIHELKSLNPETAEAFALEGQQLMTRIANLNPVTIVAIHAACVGGGWELSLACDFRMLAESARIGLPEVTLGIIPGWGGLVRTTKMFGSAIAKKMILTGELFSAKEAYRLGLVESVSPDEEFRKNVDERVAQILSRAPQSSKKAKQLIVEFDSPKFEDQLKAEARLFGECYATGEPTEGCAAFLEKRDPDWGK